MLCVRVQLKRWRSFSKKEKSKKSICFSDFEHLIQVVLFKRNKQKHQTKTR